MRARGCTWWRVATFCAGFVVTTVVAFADGGYFRETWSWTTLALASLALIVLLLRNEIVLGRLDLVGLAALASFVGWVGLSAVWSPAPDDALREGQRGLVYVAALLAFVLLVDRRLIREHLAGIAAAATLVAAYGFGQRLVDRPIARDPTQGTLLIEPLGYANALGILAALGLVLSVGLAVDAASRRGRALWLAPTAVLLPTLVLTESRGASLALVAGLSVLVLVERRRIAALLPNVRSPLRVLGAALAVVVAVVTIAVDRAEGPPLGPRVDYWRVAWHQWEDNPRLGAGAGTFARYWQQEETSSAVLDAHSLYLETLAELGPAGLALLLAALGTPILAALRARGRPSVGIGASAYATYLVHAGLDWDWEIPAVTLVGLLCAVALLAGGRPASGEITIGARGRAVFAVAALAVAGVAIASDLAD